jgi:hypothetical protein
MLRRAVATSLSVLLVVAIATPAAATLWCRTMGQPMTTCCCGHDEDAAPGPTLARGCCERTVAAPVLPTVETRAANALAAPIPMVMPPTAPALTRAADGREATRIAALDPRPPPSPARAQLATWIL